MPRQPRIDFPGLLHHVIARGIERRAIFRDAIDYCDFVRRLSVIVEETGTFCYTWALMPNHIHLLLQTGITHISKVMQRLLTGYATTFNHRHKRAGHLFQNRYKDILCENDPYFMELIRYIPLNPARANIVKTPQELARYPWTGHAAILGHAAQPWQAIGPVLETFGSSITDARARYEAHVIEGWGGKKTGSPGRR
jgi:REP element-mobilizing transposase RayT